MSEAIWGSVVSPSACFRHAKHSVNVEFGTQWLYRSGFWHVACPLNYTDRGN
jgi:hypothetical protein